MAIDGKRLLDDLKALARFGALEGGGIDRPSFSPAWMDACGWLSRRMREAGLRVRVDAAGNVIGRIGPESGPAVICGSHIDTVPQGGAYDGALGVIAGLECARALALSGAPLDKALEVIAFTDEEGAYLSMFGSRAMIGALNLEEASAATGRQGETLASAMSKAGFDIALLPRAARPRSDFAAYLELHIEQGPVLEAKGLDVGIVDSIIGIDTTEYVLIGEARHAGTTPMAERKDAGRAAGEAIALSFAEFDRAAAPADRLTFGSVELSPGASNVVAGRARVVSEVRAGRMEDVERLRGQVDDAFGRIAAKVGVILAKRSLWVDRPAPMAAQLVDIIGTVCGSLGRRHIIIPSGASHDAVNFAGLVPTGMIFIASKGGISHHPDEFSEPRTVVAGAQVLFETLRRLL